MATQITFDPYLGWVDAGDPNNIPADIKIISAADLLRYENFAIAARDEINRINSVTPTYSTSVYAPGAAVANGAPAGAIREPLDPNVVFTGKYGPTGKATLRLSAFYSFTAAVDLNLSLLNGTTEVAGTVRPVALGAQRPADGTFTATFTVTGTVDTSFSLTPAHLASVADVAIYRAGGAYGATILEIIGH